MELFEVLLRASNVVSSQSPSNQPNGPLELLLLNGLDHIEGLCNILNFAWYLSLTSSDVDAGCRNSSDTPAGHKATLYGVSIERGCLLLYLRR